MSFSKVKKSAFNSMSRGLNSVETAFVGIDETLSVVVDYVQETRAIRDSKKEERMELKALNAQRELELESQESRLEFHKALIELDSSIKKLEELDPELKERYKHLL